jgi:uncharacterized protein
MKKKILSRVFTLVTFYTGLFLALFPVYGQTYTVDKVPNDRLKDKYDFVSNPDNILSPQAEQRLNSLILAVEDSATVEIAVVLLQSIGNADIDDFGTALFTRWGIGKRQKDNGLLFLLIKDQRQMIFRTGYGLEGVLPDVILSRVIRNDIVPLLANGDFDQGVLNGMYKVGNYLLNPEAVKEIMVQEKDAQQKQRKSALNKILTVYVIISCLVLAGFLYALHVNSKRKSKEERYNRLNAIKVLVMICALLFPLLIIFVVIYLSRLKTIRNTSPICPQCQLAMSKQSKTTDNTYLTAAQSKEEEIKSVDYDVWLCPQCGYHTVSAYDKPYTKYIVCPDCKARTYSLKKDCIIRNATTFSSGQGEKTYQCLNCQKIAIVLYTIPMMVISSGSGGGNRGGGSFGGGSFGGGHTGGGGARGGW